MAILLKFAQSGYGHWGFGVSGVGTLSLPVTVSNSDGLIGKYVLLARPKASSVPLGTVLATSTTAAFTPDKEGTVQVGLFDQRETDFSPDRALAKLDFIVPFASGHRLPGFRSTPETYRPVGTDHDMADDLEALLSEFGRVAVVTVTTSITSLTAEEAAADMLYLAGSPPAGAQVQMPSGNVKNGGRLAVFNSTARGLLLVDGDGNTPAAIPDGGLVEYARLDNTLQPIARPRVLQSVTGAGGTTVLEPGSRTVLVTTAAAIQTVRLPDPVTGTVVVVKDSGGSAAARNITVTTASGTIDGSASLVIATNRQAVEFEAAGAVWHALAKY